MSIKNKRIKVGDLVELSAAGKKRNHNHSYYGGFGMVTSIRSGSAYPITAVWMGAEFGEKYIPNGRFKAYELKRKR